MERGGGGEGRWWRGKVVERGGRGWVTGGASRHHFHPIASQVKEVRG